MNSVQLPTAQSSLRSHIHRPSKPVVGFTHFSSRSRIAVAVLSRDETSMTPPPPKLPLPRLKVSPNSLQYPAGYLGAVPERTNEAENGSIAEAMEYLTNILSTKVYDIAIESPLQLAKKLSKRLGVRMYLKREDLQPVSNEASPFIHFG